MSQMTIAEAPTPGTALAMWWAEQLGAPVYKIVTDDATGEDRRIGDMTFLMASLAASHHPVSDEAGRKFVEALAPVVDEMVDSGWASLGVDYGPDRELANAADAAGIHRTRFPFKTMTWAKKDHVTVSLGYGAPSTLIWSSPGWEHPQCGQRDYHDEGVRDVICSKLRYHPDEHGDWRPDPARCGRCGGMYSAHSWPAKRDHSWEQS